MIEQIEELRNRDPFRTFYIVTASGESYKVSDPNQLAIGKAVLFLFTRGDHFTFIRNNQITAVRAFRSAA